MKNSPHSTLFKAEYSRFHAQLWWVLCSLDGEPLYSITHQLKATDRERKKIIQQMTGSMKLSPPWEAASCTATQEFPQHFMEPEGSLPCSQETLHWSLHLSHINPVYTTPSYLSKSSSILSTYRRLGLPSGLFPSCFPTNILHSFLFSPIWATYLAHLTLLNLIILL
jgi:hypothetical protein